MLQLLRGDIELVIPETIDHSTLCRLAEAGAVRETHVVGQRGGWSVLVRYGTLERALAAQRSRQVRLFRKLETLVGYLKDIGIAHFEVDSVLYDPSAARTGTRPDRSLALKRAHEAAAYETWFREQVQASLDDERPAISDEDARRIFAAKKAALRRP
ncbi:MAG TPA: hypothetical protein VGO76_12050 [Luteibacter sp.]|jgi:hypothetical protein|nr:hypothetical protein [Luteibacter sp.]